MKIQLKDKRAVVTGAAQGLGKSIAVRLLDEGCRVLLADIQEARLAETGALLKQKYGPGGLPKADMG